MSSKKVRPKNRVSVRRRASWGCPRGKRCGSLERVAATVGRGHGPPLMIRALGANGPSGKPGPTANRRLVPGTWVMPVSSPGTLVASTCRHEPRVCVQWATVGEPGAPPVSWPGVGRRPRRASPTDRGEGQVPGRREHDCRSSQPPRPSETSQPRLEEGTDARSRAAPPASTLRSPLPKSQPWRHSHTGAPPPRVAPLPAGGGGC